jgi:hypothetical protein
MREGRGGGFYPLRPLRVLGGLRARAVCDHVAPGSPPPKPSPIKRGASISTPYRYSRPLDRWGRVGWGDARRGRRPARKPRWSGIGYPPGPNSHPNLYTPEKAAKSDISRVIQQHNNSEINSEITAGEQRHFCNKQRSVHPWPGRSARCSRAAAPRRIRARGASAKAKGSRTSH